MPLTTAQLANSSSNYYNFYRSGRIYTCQGGSVKCFSVGIGDDKSPYIQEPNMLYTHEHGAGVDLKTMFFVSGGQGMI